MASGGGWGMEQVVLEDNTDNQGPWCHISDIPDDKQDFRGNVVGQSLPLAP
jgi:hypothetical protein